MRNEVYGHVVKRNEEKVMVRLERHSPSSRTMVPEITRVLTEMSTRRYLWS
jgi:hypothetical protein